MMFLASVLYGVFWTPEKAWHPFSRRSFKSLGVVFHLGLAGVGQTASEWWSWELIGCEYWSTISFICGFFVNIVAHPPSGSQLVSFPSFRACCGKIVTYDHLIDSLGPVSLAAQSVLLVSASTSYQAPFALSIATSVRWVDCIS